MNSAGNVSRHVWEKIAVALLCVLPLALTFSTPAFGRGMSSEDLLRLRWVEEARVSPTGEYIAYTLRVPRDPFEDNGPANYELHVCDMKGNSRPFVVGKVTVEKIDWTPDGKFISYISKRHDDEQEAIYMIPIDGGESRRVIEHKTEICEYSWAPDGYTLAFLAEDTISEKTDSLKELGFDQEVYEEDWRTVRVWIYDIKASDALPQPLELSGSASSLHWSPTGSLLGLALAPTSLIDDEYMFRRLSIVDPVTGKLVHKFKNPGKLGDFAWSTDGKQLAFITGADEHDPSASELALALIEEKKIIPIITDYDGHIRDVAWLNEETLIYRSDQGVYTTVGRINIDGTGNEILLAPVGPPLLDLSISGDGKAASLIGSNYDYPWELFVYRIGDKEASRLTNSNPWLDEIELGRQEVINYAAHDGLILQGILIYPANETERQNYPSILSVHGGPESHHRNGWLTWYSVPGQIAASEGFAVFYPNYRGSTGRGVEFSKMGQGDYAGDEFNDLVDAVKHLADLKIIDSKKVGITGRSYGGYATAWASTALSKYFAAGVMGAGISDLISKFGTTDIPKEMYLVHARYWPWERWQWFLERSPIYHAENSKTPLLILHGEDDTRVHPGQSLELYRYLKTLNKAPVRLVLYPGEEHGTKDIAACYDINRRMMRWFRHYLLGPGGDPPPYDLEYRPLNSK